MARVVDTPVGSSALFGSRLPEQTGSHNAKHLSQWHHDGSTNPARNQALMATQQGGRVAAIRNTENVLRQPLGTVRLSYFLC